MPTETVFCTLNTIDQSHTVLLHEHGPVVLHPSSFLPLDLQSRSLLVLPLSLYVHLSIHVHSFSVWSRLPSPRLLILQQALAPITPALALPTLQSPSSSACLRPVRFHWTSCKINNPPEDSANFSNTRNNPKLDSQPERYPSTRVSSVYARPRAGFPISPELHVAITDDEARHDLSLASVSFAPQK